MKPEYWIGILALAGAIVGYAAFKTTGWLGAGLGATVGIIIGAILYAGLKNKQKNK